MSPIRRSIFFWSLTFTFLATTPVIIFFLMGYRYSFERGVFIYTGSVSIQANPSQNLDIQIDGKSVSAESNRLNGSYHIEGILPGKHSVSVSAPGFTTWSKEIVVRSGIATEFWNVLLARTEYAPKALASFEGGQAFFPLPEKNLIAVIEKNDEETVAVILNTSTGEKRQIFGTTDFFLDEKSPKDAIRWSSRNTANILLSLVSKPTGEEHTFLIRTDTLQTTDMKDIVQVPNPKDVRWNPDANGFFFLSGTDMYSIPIDQPFHETKLSGNVGAYDPIGSFIIALDPNTGLLYRFPSSNPSQKEQLTTAPPEGFSSTPSLSFSLVAYDETRVAFLDRNTGNLFLFNAGPTGKWLKILSDGVRGMQFSDDGKKLLYWTDWEIFAFFTRKWEVQPARDEDDRLDIGRFSNSIHDVQWTKDYEHVLFFSGNNLRVIELDDRGGRDTVTLLNSPETPIQLSGIGSKNEVLLLAHDTQSDNQTDLSSITFPEPTGFFGFGQ